MSLANHHFSPMTELLSAIRPKQHKVAFVADHVFTWADFQADVAQNTQRLLALPAQRVALCFGDSYQFAVSFYSCCYAEKSIVLPGNYQPEAVRELSEHFDLLLHDDVIHLTGDIQTINPVIGNSSSVPSWSSLSAQPCQITLFTSGSSGKPKAITKSLLQLDTEIAILESLWGAQLADSKIESTVSHQHIYGLLFRVLWPLCAGRPFAVYNLEFPEQVVQHANIDTTLISSPALLKRLNDEHNQAKLRAIFSSGGPLPNNAAQHSESLFNALPMEVFGSTETGGIAYRQQHSSTTPWTLFPGIKAELNSERCLRLKSPHIDGEHWYQTADECYFHDTVTFELRGRTDRIVKVEEKRVSLVEVEKRLEQLEWIEESAVIAISDTTRLSLCAVIVLTDMGNDELEKLGKGKFWLALRKALRDWLEPIAIPRKFRLVDEVPLNSQGKRQVSEIEKLFQS